MTVVIVDEGQWLRDIAIQYSGSISEVFAVAMANGLSITDDIAPGLSLNVPNVVDANLVQFFSDKGYVPATGLSVEDRQAERGGISYMGITTNFKVGQ
jgi:hypothetical protein